MNVCLFVYACMYVCIYVCVYACMYIFACINVYVHVTTGALMYGPYMLGALIL